MTVSIWQISAGDSGRDYSDVFLRFGLMAVGPGSDGPWTDVDAYRDPESWSYREWMHDFCENVEDDDLVILKQPYKLNEWRIVAVGRVTSGYAWQEALADVEGWDLQHTHAVEWRKPLRVKRVKTGYVRRTLARVGNPKVQQLAEQIWAAGEPVPSQRLPTAAPQLRLENLIDSLVEHGLPVGRGEEIIAAIERVRRLARWYQNHQDDVGKHEIRTFLIIPLLLALGWPEQRIKVEFRRVDVALFERSYEPDATPTIVVESKRLYAGLGVDVSAQAAAYAAGYKTCHSLVISDGFRYKLAERRRKDWHESAYASLLDLRDRHPIDVKIKGARELFLALLP